MTVIISAYTHSAAVIIDIYAFVRSARSTSGAEFNPSAELLKEHFCAKRKKNSNKYTNKQTNIPTYPE